MFKSTKKYVKYFSGTMQIELWKFDRMSEDKIENITKSDSNFAPASVDHYLLRGMDFNGRCLIKSNIYTPKNVINLYVC